MWHTLYQHVTRHPARAAASDVMDPPHKRRRGWEEDPHVTLSYSNLPRSSVVKLEELVRQWCASLSSRPNKAGTEAEVLASGSFTFFPEPKADEGIPETPKVLWCADISRRPHTERAGAPSKPASALVHHLTASLKVPSYDRAQGVSLLGRPSDSRNLLQAEGDSARTEGNSGTPSLVKDLSSSNRCFNCGSYVHALKDCPKPRDNSAIGKARAVHNSTKGSSSKNEVSDMKRYHGLTRSERKKQKFEGLEPGVMCSELRMALGVQDLDPPPWLSRMRQLGYPPGYLSYGETESSEDEELLPLHLAGDEVLDTKGTPKLGKAMEKTVGGGVERLVGAEKEPPEGETGENLEDGEFPPSSPPSPSLPFSPSPPSSAPKDRPGLAKERPVLPRQLAQFPGINAPIPAGASKAKWDSPLGSSRRNRWSQSESNRWSQSESNRWSQSESNVRGFGTPSVAEHPSWAPSASVAHWSGIFQGWDGWMQGYARAHQSAYPFLPPLRGGFGFPEAAQPEALGSSAALGFADFHSRVEQREVEQGADLESCFDMDTTE